MTVRRRVYIVSSLVIVLVLFGAIFLAYLQRKPTRNCEFPETVSQQSIGFELYCPPKEKLPAGISADLSSASSSQNAVIYPVRDGKTTLSVSLQKKPTKDQLTNFAANIIPLHFNVSTSVGQGYIGVTSQGRSLLDLPTDTSTWILVTGPKNYDSNRMSRIAKAFVAAD